MREDIKFLIVGDTIIDEDIFLIASGLSLETPTLKTVYDTNRFNYGGAANVARRLADYDLNVTFLTSVSEEHVNSISSTGAKILNFYQGKNNTKSRYWVSRGDSTYKYLQVNSVNDENLHPLIDVNLSDYDIVAFSDYRCGLITEPFINTCVKHKGIETYASSQISSRQSNYFLYNKVDYIVCNEKESRSVGRDSNICVTKGDKGCSFKGIDYEGYKVEDAVSTMGAGDAFYAAFLASGDPEFANMEASNFVESLSYV
tara:strand:+ start:2337 stop:3110 length:774 start_codon:yes stop_codon:yes gene_type:complete